MAETQLDLLNAKKVSITTKIAKHEKAISELRQDLMGIDAEIVEIVDLRELRAYRQAKELAKSMALQQGKKIEDFRLADFEKIVSSEIERVELEQATKPKKGRPAAAKAKAGAGLSDIENEAPIVAVAAKGKAK